MANQKIKKIIKELQGASKMHLKQSKQLAKHVDSKESPAKHQIAHKHSDGSKHGYVEPPVKAKKPSPFKQRSPLLVDTCWDGYHAEGKKKSPSNKKTSGGTIKMVNNCVED